MIRIPTPLEQFEIHPIIKLALGWIDLSITNATVSLLLVVVILSSLSHLVLNHPRIIPTRWQSFLEYLYQFIKDLVKEQIGEKGTPYFPLIFTLFSFIVLCNLIGMIPYSLTVTTQILITFTLSLTIFLGVTLLGFSHHGISFLRILLPAGASLILAPLLIVIELISYFARAISLAVRLAANMMAGHTLLKIISTFAWKMILAGGMITLAGLVPLALLFVLTGLELAIAILQAYVFTVLTCSYINDSINLH
jgi:ATP synthase subunit 6